MFLKCSTLFAALALLLALAGCGGFDTGLNPRPDVRKEQGPLTVPPPSALRGTAIDR